MFNRVHKILKRHSEKSRVPIPQSVWTNPIHFIACGFGLGLFPIMPGTIGTLLGVVLVFIFAKFSLLTYIILTVLFVVAGVWLCGVTNRDFGTKDHPAIIWDEIATFPIVMIAVPLTWYYLLIGFVLFRIFDIWKPEPIGWIDRNVPGGFGVMLDDVLAALASLIILQIIIWFTG